MFRQSGNVILFCAMAFGPAAGQQRAQTSPALAQAGQSQLTDRDVIQMAGGGKAEASVVATIRSSRTNFDLSPQSCKLLTAAHVSRTILNAMAAPGQTACDSISQPSPRALTPGPQTSSSGTLLGNRSPTLLGGASVQAPSGGSHALNPQPLPPGTATRS